MEIETIIKRRSNHRHTWVCSSDGNEIYCETCLIDFDKWHDKMINKGYTEEQLKRFEN